MSAFEAFDLAAPITRAILDSGYTDPSPIQTQAIPIIKSGRDVLGIAQTGTGKTLAFAAPTLHKLCEDQKPAPKKACRVLVLAPTRELCAQIAESFKTYANFMGIRVATAFGGVKISGQKRILERGAHVLVATPGRLEDLMQQGAVSLGQVDTLILDEADHMLDLGFIVPLRRIVKQVPKQRQTLFFSATMPGTISDLAGAFLDNPETVSVTPESTTAERVHQLAYHIGQRDKPALLTRLLKDKSVKQALVFTRTKHGADRLVRELNKSDIGAVAIHGNKSQPQRRRALEAFKSGEVWVLVATDIAARGIDISGLSHVFNYELPNVPEQYVHRIGRTGRANQEGTAVSLIANDERAYLKDIEKLIRQPLERELLPDGFHHVEEAAEPRRREGGGSRNGPRRRPQQRSDGPPKSGRGGRPSQGKSDGGRSGGKPKRGPQGSSGGKPNRGKRPPKATGRPR